MAEGAAGDLLAPCELGPAQQAAEEARVQRIEDLLKVVEAALGTEETLVAASAANQLRLAGDGDAGGKALIAQVLRRVDGLFVEFGQENVGDGVEDGFGRALQQIGKIDMNPAFAEADGG